MPFGLKMAPAAFQRFMNELFQDMIDACVVIYLNNILIYSKNKEEHKAHVKAVLQRLQENHLFCKPSKCEFYIDKVTFIGIVITPEVISMEKEKIKPSMEWQEPKTVKQLQSFLGFAKFYRRFVRNFSNIVKPSTKMTRKDIKWEWGTMEQAAFEQLKKEMTKDPVLVHPDPKKPYFLETNVSGVTMGSTLSQRQEDGYLHPIAFMSESFNNAQRNYITHDKELLAIIRSLVHRRLFLEGTDEPISVYTNHQNLEYWQKVHACNRRHARLYQLLAPFNFNIHYRPVEMLDKPDTLSRRHDHADKVVGREFCRKLALAHRIFAVLTHTRNQTLARMR
jgi:hypothetical protein